MKSFFDRNLVIEAQSHAQSEYPKESCGFIMENCYKAVENIAEDPINDFRIHPKVFLSNIKGIKAIVHSHADYPHISKQDMISQKRTAIPWGVTLLQNGAVIDTYFWGDSLPIQDFIGRPFVHGIYDCYALVRDYWRNEGHDIMDFPRDNLWWEQDPSMLEDGCQEAGFEFIDVSQLQIGDVIFMKVLADVTNHSAIYLGDGLMMHHLYNRLSRREPMGRWSKHITRYLRYKNA